MDGGKMKITARASSSRSWGEYIVGDGQKESYDDQYKTLKLVGCQENNNAVMMLAYEEDLKFRDWQLD